MSQEKSTVFIKLNDISAVFCSDGFRIDGFSSVANLRSSFALFFQLTELNSVYPPCFLINLDIIVKIEFEIQLSQSFIQSFVP